ANEGDCHVRGGRVLSEHTLPGEDYLASAIADEITREIVECRRLVLARSGIVEEDLETIRHALEERANSVVRSTSVERVGNHGKTTLRDGLVDVAHSVDAIDLSHRGGNASCPEGSNQK